MRFLEREVYTFCGKRVRGVMPWARIFLFMGGPQETTWGRRWTGRSTCEELAGRAIRKERHAKARGKKGKKEVFRGKDRRAFAYPLGGGRDRAAAIAALGHRHRRENVACAGCGTGWKNPAGGGLWPPSQLIQLIYLRYLCVSTEREKRMDVYFLLTLYI